MNTYEIYTDNFAEALLRATLLLGNLHRPYTIRRISIFTFSQEDHSRAPSPQCIISMNLSSAFNPPQYADADSYVDFDILFPAYSPYFS